MLRHLLQPHLFQAEPPQFALQHLAPLRDVVVTLLPAKPLAYLLPRRGSRDVAIRGVEPVAARPLLRLAGANLHHIAALQGIIERHQLLVHGSAHAVMADIGVNTVSEINGGCASRELYHIACRSEDVYVVLQNVRLHGLDELLRVCYIVAPLQQLA